MSSLFIPTLASLVFSMGAAWGEPPADTDADAFDRALEAALGWDPAGGGRVGPEPRPPADPPPDKEPWARRMGAPVDLPGETAGALSGRAVYLSQCHGWIWYDSLEGFSTQRGNLFDTVEDFHNPEATNQYLARYLENAGAAVYTARERDLNPLSAVADNDAEGYSESGSGFVTGAAGFADQAPWMYGDDPFSAGTTRRFPADGGAKATWVPEVPADGRYAVYVSWDAAADHARQAHYRITHPGGVIDRTFDQTVHGSTWQYVEHLWLAEGTGSLTVELIADGGESGRWLSADAVRIGGGMGDVWRQGEATGRPRWEEGAIHYTQYNGAPTSVYDPYGDGNGSDPSSRSRWAAWEHPEGESAVYLSWHSNAGGGQGTSTYIYEGDYTPVVGSDLLGERVQEELMSAITTLWDADWSDRGLNTAAFSELSPAHNDEMPAALVELAFHDLEDDASLLKEPAFRRDAARAMYRAIVYYFAEAEGGALHFLPEPPEAVALLHTEAGTLELSWSPGPVGDPFGDAPDAYVIYRSVDGRSWDNGTLEVDGSVTQVTLEAAPGEVVYARVAARNAGGTSFPSEVMGARRSPDGRAPVLVVAGFDRLRASNLLSVDVGGAVGTVVRMDLPAINNFDGVVAHGEAIADAGWYFESAADERLTALADDLSAHTRLVWWIAGEESSEDTTLDSMQQEVLSSFWDGGGALWVTGAEVLWDLDARGSAADQAFVEAVLGARLADDDAGTTRSSGEGLLGGLLLDFDVPDGAPYPVEYPDVLETADAAVVRYASGGVAGSLGERRALLGFPFECIGDEAVRAEVAARLLPALVPDYVPPEPGEDTGGGGGGGGADSGLLVGEGRGGGPPGEAISLLEVGGCSCQTPTRAGRGGWAGLGAGAILLLRRRRRHRRGG